MKFTEVDFFGIYVAPISVMLIAAWLLLVPLRRIGDRLELSRQVWHPALFWFAGYMILLSVIVHLVAA
jgi:hypothetical protein